LKTLSILVFILSRLSRLLLRLFPRQYWTEFGEELLEVYDLALQEAGEKGTRPALSRALRELHDLTGVFIRVQVGRWARWITFFRY
jgi:hypothetical protein